LNRSGPLDPSKEQYGEFTAAELFCPRCGTAVPVREKLLLILPDGELYEYLCVHCGASLGDKTTKGKENIRIVIS
jgi:DNA-directed RNA polymerase subunit RPC12/RpoP